MKLRRIVQKAHRWLGLLLFAQVLVWMASGVVMSWFHITLVRGEPNALTYFAPDLEARSYASPGGVIAQLDGAKTVELQTFLDKPTYFVTGSTETALFDAVTGARLTPLGEGVVRKIAKRDFVGDGEIKSIKLVSDPPHEYRGAKPVWQVIFDDDLQTRLYVSQHSGKVLARRNKIWRVYDFFWMLHIMDYGERENFNNPLIRAASATGLIFALTGLFLVVTRISSGRYRDDVRRTSTSADGD